MYQFGNPDGEEQYYIELINRARADPPAEGLRLASTTDATVLGSYSYFAVNLGMFQSEMDAIPAAPPLAPSAGLTQAARGHSDWMLANGVQSHTGSGGSSPGTRVSAAGYNWATCAENIYAYSKSVWYGHAGLEVDWGPGSGGMQTGRGHRTNNHNPNFREIGVGVTNGTNGSLGPQVVTLDFGRQQSSPTFATGVAYFDLNGNDFYDPGEGIPGLTVNVDGASFFCTTAEGGGWVVPVPSTAATRAVTFSGPGFSHTADLAIPASTNAKLDLKLDYLPPSIVSPAVAHTGQSHTLSFSSVPGATNYRWKRWTTAPAPAENCESIDEVTASTAYPILNGSVKYQGSYSFHLVKGGVSNDQWIELGGLYRGAATSAMSFRSRIRYSTTSETYSVQVREEGGLDWQEVYSQNGYNGAGEAAFALRNVDLSGYAGKSFRIRFCLKYNSGSYYPGATDIYGWFVDALQFSDLERLENEEDTILAGTSGVFTPMASGSFLQGVFPEVGGVGLPGSYQVLNVMDGPPPGFASWASETESAHSLPAGSLADPDGDHDRDGLANLIEYAFGTSPVNSNSGSPRLPVSAVEEGNFVVIYQVDTSVPGLLFQAETCGVLTTWKCVGEAGAPAGFTDEVVSTNGTIETHRVTLPLGSGQGFVRVNVTEAP